MKSGQLNGSSALVRELYALPWRERAILDTPDPPVGVQELPEATEAAEAESPDGGLLVAHLYGRPPVVLLSVTYQAPGLEEGEGPDLRPPTFPEVYEALCYLVPEGAVMSLPYFHAPGLAGHDGFTSTTVWLSQIAARKGSPAASGLVLPAGAGPFTGPRPLS